MNKSIHIQDLLQQWIDSAPQRNLEIYTLLQDSGIDRDAIDAELAITLGKPLQIDTISTIGGTSLPLTPFLSERFFFAGTIQDGTEKWLNQREIGEVVHTQKFQKQFQSICVDWDGAYISQFSPDRISVLSIDSESIDIVFLVWEDLDHEPKVCSYKGHNEMIYDDLLQYLEVLIEFE